MHCVCECPCYGRQEKGHQEGRGDENCRCHYEERGEDDGDKHVAVTIESGEPKA